MKQLKLYSTFLALAAFAVFCCLSSCSDIIEEDISGDQVEIIGPIDTLIDYATITFWWNDVQGASSYRLQMINPSFTNPIRLVLDTVITGTKFNYTPAIGKYEWRVRAENSGYQSLYTEPQLLEIKDSNDLSRIEVNLLSPDNNSFTKDTLIRFSWTDIPIATSYTLHIEGADTVDIELTTNSFQYKLPKEEQLYYWSVVAVNEISTSASQQFKFTVDPLDPAPPALLLPESDSAFAMSDSVTFSWLHEDGVVADSFFIEKKQADDTWLPFSGFTPRLTTEQELTLTSDDFTDISTTEDFRWSVISIDRAGNKSSAAQRPFTFGSL